MDDKAFLELLQTEDIDKILAELSPGPLPEMKPKAKAPEEPTTPAEPPMDEATETPTIEPLREEPTEELLQVEQTEKPTQEKPIEESIQEEPIQEEPIQDEPKQDEPKQEKPVVEKTGEDGIFSFYDVSLKKAIEEAIFAGPEQYLKKDEPEEEPVEEKAHFEVHIDPKELEWGEDEQEEDIPVKPKKLLSKWKDKAKAKKKVHIKNVSVVEDIPEPEEEELIPHGEDSIAPYIEETEEADSFDEYEETYYDEPVIQNTSAPSFFESIFPMVGDKFSVIIRKGLIWICAIVILACCIMLIVNGGHFSREVAAIMAPVMNHLADTPLTLLIS